MAENIISDLRQAGSDNMDSLMNLMETYKLKQYETEKEIKKLHQLIALKDDEAVGVDQDINELQLYLGTAKDKLDQKIQDMLKFMEENKRIIRKQDKHIVDLQQRNEISQSSILESNMEATRKAKEKQEIQLKMRELDGKKNNLHENINIIESKITTFRSICAQN
jgi:chromosome segregation ATPase